MLPNCKIIYLNLDERLDRKEHIEKQLKDLGMNDFERFSAIKRNPGWEGHTLSFVAILEKAINEKYEQLLIVEDDMLIEDIPKFKDSMKSFEENIKNNFDVLLLGGNNQGSLKEKAEYYCKITKTFAGAAYLVNKHYYKTFLDRLMISKKFIMEHPGVRMDHVYASDVIMNKIQAEDNWYLIFPHGAVQLPGYSDILKRNVDYSCYMKNLEPVTRWTQ